MQPRDFKSTVVRTHYILALQGTNNTMFRVALDVPMNDKREILPDPLRTFLGVPSSVQTMYDYRSLFPGLYNRLFQLCVISLCADVEFFFKEYFGAFAIARPSAGGFFQRFPQVIGALTNHGLDFSNLSTELGNVEHAFMVRHICVHNFGIVDERFAKTALRPVAVGTFYEIDQVEYRRMFDSYVTLLVSIDRQTAT